MESVQSCCAVVALRKLHTAKLGVATQRGSKACLKACKHKRDSKVSVRNEAPSPISNPNRRVSCSHCPAHQISLNECTQKDLMKIRKLGTGRRISRSLENGKGKHGIISTTDLANTLTAQDEVEILPFFVREKTDKVSPHSFRAGPPSTDPPAAVLTVENCQLAGQDNRKLQKDHKLHKW